MVGSGLLVAALVGAFTVLTPASAQSAIRQLISFACFDHQQCLKITNTAPDGNAFVGVAQNNNGIVGQTNVNKNNTTNATFPGDGWGGVFGVDTSTNKLDTNLGVLGLSMNGGGVAGATYADSSTDDFPQSGVGGLDLSTTVNGNAGVVGSSNLNIGVQGFSSNPNTGVGVWGEDDGNIGVVGATFSATFPGGGVVGAAELGNGGFFETSDPNLEALAILNNGGGPLIGAYGGPGGNTKVMALDNAGNLTITGALVQHGTPMSIASTSSGGKVVSYAPQQSVRTMEDVGEAQLVHGQAIVRLEPTFASAIDTRRSYLVFITPQGDTNGLYVMEKTAAGFVVREHNGASNIVFDYRIVAQPYGLVAQRLPLYTGTHEAADAAELGMMRRQMTKVSRRLHMRSAHLRFIH